MFTKKTIAFVILLSMMTLLFAGCVTVKVEEETGVKAGQEITGEPKKDGKSEEEILLLREELEGVSLISADVPRAIQFDDYEGRMEIRENYPIDDNAIEAVRAFTKKSVAALDAEGDNLIYSPLSLYYALGILASGSVGQAETELTDLLGLNKNEIVSSAEAIYRNIYKDNEIGKTQISNSIWVDRNKGISFKVRWFGKVATRFFASVYEVDFNDSATGDLMGQWISDTTGKMLEYDFDPNPSQVMSIINSVYLSDQWTDFFDEELTAKDIFTNRDKTTSECEFLNSEGYGTFYKTDEYSMSSISLKNGGSVTFILPAEGVDPRTMLYDESVHERISGWVEDDEARGNGPITWKIPKFSYQSDLDLVEMLRSLGVNAVFDTTDGLTDITDDDLFVSDVIQKAAISVDEKGIEAAAYTEITYCGSALPTDECDMILDRPFAYIVETDYGVPIFVGVVNEM